MVGVYSSEEILLKFKSRSRDLGHAPFFVFLFSIPDPQFTCKI